SGRFDRAAQDADEAVALLSTGEDSAGFDDILGTVLLRVGVARLLCGDLSRAVESFSEAWRWSMTFPHPLAPYVAGHCALTYALAGDYAHAEKWLARSEADPVTD